MERAMRILRNIENDAQKHINDLLQGDNNTPGSKRQAKVHSNKTKERIMRDKVGDQTWDEARVKFIQEGLKNRPNYIRDDVQIAPRKRRF